MATWTPIPENLYKQIHDCPYAQANGFSNKGYITLEYDKEAITLTSIKLRFKFSVISSSINLYDTYYVLLDPNNENSRKLIALKTAYTNPEKTSTVPDWPYYSSAFIITKAATAEAFTLPTLWICNNGWDDVKDTEEDFYNEYKDGIWRGDNLKSVHSSKPINAEDIGEEVVATPGTAPTVYIRDNGNNTFTISGELGTKGNLNPLESATLYYTTNGDDPSNSDSARTKVSLNATSGASYSKNISITKACTARAHIVCEFEHNTTSASTSKPLAVKYYAAPEAPGKPELDSSSFRNSRLTAKQDWGWNWTAATAANTGSPVVGYRVRFYINGINTCMLDPNDASRELSEELTSGDYVFDRTRDTYPMPMKPTMYNIKPGDSIKLSVQAYTKNGAGTKLLSSRVSSDSYKVQNAGVVNVKVNNAWKEGQVYVKVSGSWREAETVSVRVGGSWKESQ